MTDITPLNGYVLLKRYVKPEKKGILLLKDDKVMHMGIVTSYEWTQSKMDIKDGSLVQYKTYTAIPVEGHEDYLLVKEEDILATLPMPKEFDV